MTNTLYLDETLTGFEREIAIESAKMDISMQKLDALYEAVDANLQANYKEAELKVYAENGTYDDLAMLYMEAENDAAEKKGGILTQLFNAIATFCGKIINGIKSLFKKSSESKAVPQDTILEVEADDNKKLDMSSKIVGKATGFLHGIKGATKDGCDDLIKFVKDNIGFVAVTGTAAAGAVAGTTHLITKKVTKASFEKKINDQLEGLDEAKKAVEVGKLAVKAGELIFKDDSSADNKSASQSTTESQKTDDKKSGNTETTEQPAPAANTTNTSNSGSTSGKKGSKILDAVKSALSWIGKGIKAIGTFLSDIWKKYIGKLFSKNNNNTGKQASGTNDTSETPNTDSNNSDGNTGATNESEAKPEETKTESTIDFLLDLI